MITFKTPDGKQWQLADGQTINLVEVASQQPAPAPAQPVPSSSSHELRPGNAQYNVTVDQNWLHNLLARDKILPEARNQQFMKMLDGSFVGDTRSIYEHYWRKYFSSLFPVDWVLAIAQNESGWHQDAHGDAGNVDAQHPNGGSWGSFQIKENDWPWSWPGSHNSTPFNADWYCAELRSIYEGYVDYLNDPSEPKIASSSIPDPDHDDKTLATAPYKSASGLVRLLGCIGWHYSGHWFDEGAIRYIGDVVRCYKTKAWTKPGF